MLRDTSNSSNSGSGIFGKSSTDKRGGKALVAVAITEQQVSQQRQYNDDSSTVEDGLDTMSNSLDALNSDIKELSRCVSKNTVSAQLLQKVQARVNKEIRGALKSEKNRMMAKDARLIDLEKKLTRIRRKQKNIQASSRAYQLIRYTIIFVLFVYVVITSWIYFQSSTPVDPSLLSPSPLLSPAPSIVSPSSSTTLTSRRLLDLTVQFALVTKGETKNKSLDVSSRRYN